MEADPALEDSRVKDARVASIEEYKCVSAVMRQYATLRFYQLALLLGTTGSIVTALASQVVRADPLRIDLLKGGALLVSLALAVMDFRSSTYWQAMRNRANELARTLHFHRLPVSSRWSPLTTSGVGFYLHAIVAALWGASVFLRP
jgi:hypothetical protein